MLHKLPVTPSFAGAFQSFRGNLQKALRQPRRMDAGRFCGCFFIGAGCLRPYARLRFRLLPKLQNRRHHMPAHAAGRTTAGTLSERRPDDAGFFFPSDLRRVFFPLDRGRLLRQVFVRPLYRPFIAQPRQVVVVRLPQQRLQRIIHLPSPRHPFIIFPIKSPSISGVIAPT